MSGSYATIYRQARTLLEQEAEARLERPLTARERNLFRNCGTLTRLEEFGLTVYYAESAEELTARLAAASFDARFSLALAELVRRLERVLGRSITRGEQQQLRQLGNIEELWALEQRVHEAPPAEREAALSRLLCAGAAAGEPVG